jgi:hypothetical protein
MELFLNISAIVTVLALLVIWRAHWVRQPGRCIRNATRECMAVCCLAILTFFAISMTDDLQGDLMVMEECTLSRSQSVVVSATHHLHHERVRIHAVNVAILADAIILDLQYLTTTIAPAVYSSTLFLSLNLLPTRAPPLSV